MIRKESLKKLSTDKIVPFLENELIEQGFKYLKTKKHFYRTNNNFKEIIDYRLPHSSITFNENTNQLFLEFYISFSIEHPKYDKWYLTTFDERSHFSYHINRIKGQIELSFEDFTSDSFYEPTNSQKFKHLVTSSLISSNQQEETIYSIDSLIKILPKNISKLTYYCNVENILNESKTPGDYSYLFYFLGYEKLAKKQLDEYYSAIINEIEDNNQEANKLRNISYLEKFVREAKKINIIYNNPHKKKIKLENNKGDFIEFTSETKFNEYLRFDISQYRLDSIAITPKGELLFLVNGNKLLKFNNEGVLIFEQEFENQKGYKKINNYKIVSKYIEELDSLIINHFIINSENEILELKLPDQTKNIKKGYKQYPNFDDLVYSKKDNKILAIYQNRFLVYSKDGDIEKEINLGHQTKGTIVLKKEILIISTQNKETLIFDFNGNQLKSFSVGNGNINHSKSNESKYLLCYGYSTKSQLYNLTNKDKHILWAHPTYIKNYKEIMYNDTEHNFDLSISKFSPNDKYIVGGGYHGKYVAWTLPKFERTELIPTKEMINNLDYDTELIELDNQIFLKNRRNGIREIEFYENGNIFTTVLSNGYVLVWNKQFKNINFIKINGSLKKITGKYLINQNDKELVVYKNYH